MVLGIRGARKARRDAKRDLREAKTSKRARRMLRREKRREISTGLLMTATGAAIAITLFAPGGIALAALGVNKAIRASRVKPRQLI